MENKYAIIFAISFADNSGKGIFSFFISVSMSGRWFHIRPANCPIFGGKSLFRTPRSGPFILPAPCVLWHRSQPFWENSFLPSGGSPKRSEEHTSELQS